LVHNHTPGYAARWARSIINVLALLQFGAYLVRFFAGERFKSF
jgi:hypothetical protein